jgi:hypothetical protein
VSDGTGTIIPDELSVPTWEDIAPRKLKSTSTVPAAHGGSPAERAVKSRTPQRARTPRPSRDAAQPRAIPTVIDGTLDSSVLPFEFTLGILFGISSILGVFQWSDGGLGPFSAVPALALAISMILARRKDLRSLGFGLLTSLPIALLIGLVLWYAYLSR